jgi:hypothetical protein
VPFHYRSTTGKDHLSEGKRIATLCHIEMAIDLAAIRTMVSSVVEFMIGHLPDETFQVEVVDKVVAEF